MDFGHYLGGIFFIFSPAEVRQIYHWHRYYPADYSSKERERETEVKIFARLFGVNSILSAGEHAD